MPSDWASAGEIDIDGAASYTLVDAVAVGSDLWILYVDPAVPGTIKVDRFDPTAGVHGALSGSPTVVLRPDLTAGSIEGHGLNSAQVAACAPVSVTNDPLTWDGTRWRSSHIGLGPGRVTIRGQGGVCPTVGVVPGSLVPGYLNSGVMTTDGLSLTRTGSCTRFTASYTYTSCGFAGADAYRCPVEPDPVPDLNSEPGACGYMMVYESQYDGDNQGYTVDDRALLTAYARDVDGPWGRWLPSGSPFPTLADARIVNTSRHGGDDGAGLHSFVSVPTLWYDPSATLWRMWFVTEDAGRPSIRYSESDDDGQSWGIGGGDGDRIDCWDGQAFDTTACVEIDWTGTEPPDDLTSPDTRSPDTVDPEVVPGTFDTRPGVDLGMLLSGSDDGCANGDWGVLLWQLHTDDGDQSAGTNWEWVTNVAADGVDGVVMDKDRGQCSGAGTLMDPEVVRYGTGYLMFLNAKGGIHVAASGFGCSDFLDGDADGRIDWPKDPGCTSPWDTAE